MDTGLSSYPSIGFAVSQLFEYVLVVNPDREVYERLLQEKQKFSSDYDVAAGKKTLPYIIIADFLAKEEMEETIIRWMRRIISEQRSFDVMLNNYSGLPSHTVYARVQDNCPFQLLASSLQVIDEYVRNNGCPPAKLISHPNFPIARKLRPEVYEKAIFDYSKRTFHGVFRVDELNLLKRQNQFGNFRQVSVFKMSQPQSETYN